MKRLAPVFLFLLSLVAPALADTPALGPYEHYWIRFLPSGFAFADTPAMGPYGSWVVGGILPPYVAASSQGLTKLTLTEPHWLSAMQGAGICWVMFVADGSGVKLSIARPGGGCIDGPVISFPEFRRRMEAP